MSVNINTASLSDLLDLGVSPIAAERILGRRHECGQVTQDELLNIPEVMDLSASVFVRLTCKERRDSSSGTNRSNGGRHSRSDNAARRNTAVIPKHLSFDGQSNWQAFANKFMRYVTMNSLSDKESCDNLCFCLEGKASEYYCLISDRYAHLTLFELEQRFGNQDLPETSMLLFTNLRQHRDESLSDWSDRVLTVANKALSDCTETHISMQVVLKFCQGCFDKEAGQYACNMRPPNIESAIQSVKWFRHNNIAIYGHNSRNPSREYEARVQTLTTSAQDTKTITSKESKDNDRIEALEKRVDDIKDRLALPGRIRPHFREMDREQAIPKVIFPTSLSPVFDTVLGAAI
ncbi:hypothetical protein SNE40_009748 [Patella caerulea]|uniref:Uncharacterized protein n=1 Tax=Patella caerulea TaxID=87958 RepID=A0AAN8JZL8_PATCE